MGLGQSPCTSWRTYWRVGTEGAGLFYTNLTLLLIHQESSGVSIYKTYVRQHSRYPSNFFGPQCVCVSRSIMLATTLSDGSGGPATIRCGDPWCLPSLTSLSLAAKVSMPVLLLSRVQFRNIQQTRSYAHHVRGEKGPRRGNSEELRWGNCERRSIQGSVHGSRVILKN